MTRSVSIDGLAQAISAELESYTSEVEEGVREAVYETAEEARDALRSDSPVRTRKYAKSWRVKKVRGRNFAQAFVHAAGKHYRRVHLLEKGHAKRGGGRVAAIPHVRPVEDRAAKALEDRITRVVEGG